MPGPLTGVRVVELAAIGPGPFAGMLLADLGAEVIRVDRAGDVGMDAERQAGHGILDRGRQSVAVDLKQPEGVELVLKLAESADVLTEGFRPGVAERLGIGPEVVFQRNPRIVYGRMTGWGQDGPLAPRAGHDIDYIAVSGVLGMLTEPGSRPPLPQNIVGDFGGGSLYLVVGVLAALLHSRTTGQGQVVDAAIVDGAASLTAMYHSLAGVDPAIGRMFGGAMPFYRVYETADSKWLAVGAIEPQFFAELVAKLGIADHPEVANQWDRGQWPAMEQLLSATVAAASLSDWEERFDGSDACVSPVRSPDEAVSDPHLQARQTYLPYGSGWQPAPAPRLSQTSLELPEPAPAIGQDSDQVLSELGVDVTELRARGVVG